MTTTTATEPEWHARDATPAEALNAWTERAAKLEAENARLRRERDERPPVTFDDAYIAIRAVRDERDELRTEMDEIEAELHEYFGEERVDDSALTKVRVLIAWDRESSEFIHGKIEPLLGLDDNPGEIPDAIRRLIEERDQLRDSIERAAATLDEAAEATARMLAAIQGQARDGESPDQTVERLIRERDELRAERATWDSVEKERKKLATRVAELRDERERLRDALTRIAAILGVADTTDPAAIIEGAANAREELDEARLLGHAPGLVIAIQTAVPAIRAGINALGSSEEDVRSRNVARDSLHALEAAVEGAEPPTAVLSAAERKAVEALRRWRELPDERIGDPFAAEWLDVLEAADAMIEAGRPLASEGAA